MSKKPYKFFPKNIPFNPHANDAIQVRGMRTNGRPARFAEFTYNNNSLANTLTITPEAGNHQDGDLSLYRVDVHDEDGGYVTGQLDYANPTAPFAIDTSALDANTSWKVHFTGKWDDDYANDGIPVEHHHMIKNPRDSFTETSMVGVDRWNNIDYILKLASTTDTNFSFPQDGVELYRDSKLNLDEYSSAGNLVDGETYTFTLEAGKHGLNPTMAAPGVISQGLTGTAIVTYPFAPKRQYTPIHTLTLVGPPSGAVVPNGIVAFAITNGGPIAVSRFNLSYTTA